MNPYEVLGINENADIDTVKKAYRDLAKKYHPDKYAGNPLADLAEEKLKEINAAYDAICRGDTAYHTVYEDTDGEPSDKSSPFEQVRSLILQGRLSEAENMLSALPKSAEHDYLLGLIYVRREKYKEAARLFHSAFRAEPSNSEYADAVRNFSELGGSHRKGRARDKKSHGNKFMQDLSKLICADCCCEFVFDDFKS